MIVNLGVCGKFHYCNYVRYINERSVLGKFYYSHKLSTNSSLIGISEDRAINIWFKEYLIYFHLKVLNANYADSLFPRYNDLWQLFALMKWKRCDIFHVMLHGTSKRLIERARLGGSLILGEAVNSHPEIQFDILRDEHEKLGLRKNLSLSLQHRRLLKEISQTNHLLVPSSFVKESYIQKGYDPNKIHLIPYGVDLRNFYVESEQKTASQSTFRVICVAQITPRKGQIYLLEAWKKLSLPNAELLLVGRIDPVMHPLLVKYSSLYRHIERVDHTKLQVLYNQSSVFVLPSVEDGFGCVLVEALACGLPIIATTNTGATEVISHKKEGFIVPICSSEEIAHSIERLYLNPMLRQEMSLCAFEKARLNFSWKSYADNLYNLYKTLQFPCVS